MNNKVIIGVVAVVVLVGAYMLLRGGGAVAPTVAPSPTPTPTPAPASTVSPSMDVTLFEQNSSGQSGSAMLEEVGSQLSVTLNISNGTSTPQPAHIHNGSCDDLGGIAYPLDVVVDGTSEMMLDISLDDLSDQAPLAVNVHKSADEAGTYVACGDLEA